MTVLDQAETEKSIQLVLTLTLPCTMRIPSSGEEDSWFSQVLDDGYSLGTGGEHVVHLKEHDLSTVSVSAMEHPKKGHGHQESTYQLYYGSSDLSFETGLRGRCIVLFQPLQWKSQSVH